MINARLGRAIGVGAALVAASGGLYGASASAAPAPVRLTVVGSNTTQEVMGAVTAAYNASAVARAHNATATNVYAQPAGAGTFAPSDARCNAGKGITYISGANPKADQRTAPNGSKAGRAALAASVTSGDSCVSVARSSSPGASTDPAGTRAYAFAVDAVTWATRFNGAAPHNLSLSKLKGVYDCHFTNWKQVGGRSAPIYRYFPQTGSGSGTFFAGVLGFDPRVLGGVNICRTPATQIEENEATAIPNSRAADAVTIYSSGAWISQANGVDRSLRHRFVLDTINRRISPVVRLANGKFAPSRLVVERNVEPASYRPNNDTAVQGVRNLFNFINTRSVDYAAAASFVGAGSALCTGRDSALIRHYGFAPLGSCIEQS